MEYFGLRMDKLFDDIVDRTSLGFKYIGSYEPWTSPPLGPLYQGVLCYNECGYAAVSMGDENGKVYEFYHPSDLGYDIKDLLDSLGPPEYTSSVFFVSVPDVGKEGRDVIVRCSVINW